MSVGSFSVYPVTAEAHSPPLHPESLAYGLKPPQSLGSRIGAAGRIMSPVPQS